MRIRGCNDDLVQTAKDAFVGVAEHLSRWSVLQTVSFAFHIPFNISSDAVCSQ